MTRRKPRPRYEKTYLFVIPSLILIASLFFGASLLSKNTTSSIMTTFFPIASTDTDKVEEPSILGSILTERTPPAYTALSALMEFTPKGYPEPLQNKGGTPYNGLAWVCNYNMSPAPVASGEVVFPSEKMSVTVQVVGAGQGSKAVASAQDSVRSCNGKDGRGGTYIATSLITGTKGFVGYTTVGGKTNYISVWQRGDVILSVMSPNFGQVQSLSMGYDVEARSILKGVCLSLDVSSPDAKRSPYYVPADYTGWNKGRKIKISKNTYGLKAGLLSSGNDVAGSGQPLGNVKKKLDYPINGKDANAPSWEQANRPAEPLKPFEGTLPTVVTEPVTVPSITMSRPSSVTIPERVKDLEGPGCGWSFTEQSAPLWDDEVEKTRADKAEKKAQGELREEYREYLVVRANYLDAWTSYYDQVIKYRKYKKSVDAVDKEWTKLNEQRASYKVLLDNYWASVTAHDDFLDDQKDAKKQYKADVKQCEVNAEKAEEAAEKAKEEAKVKAEEEAKAEKERKEAEKKEEEENKDDDSEEPDASPSPSEKPTEEPTPEPTEEPVVDDNCPAERPSILDESAPAILPAPATPDFLIPDAWSELMEFRTYSSDS